MSSTSLGVPMTAYSLNDNFLGIFLAPSITDRFLFTFLSLESGMVFATRIGSVTIW